MEWSTKAEYNSFNSAKGLAYYENYKQIVDWLNGNDYLPPPIEVNLDPMAICNLDCYFCITQRYLKHHPEEIGMTQLPLDYMLELVDFLSDWGVKGLCISGGGEPTLHKDLPKLIEYASTKMDICLVTNATTMDDDLLEALVHCRWIALSIDAANKATYAQIKGRDKFYSATRNIFNLVGMRKLHSATVDLCFKFLVVPENQYEIYDACKLAKSLGVQDFHARPVDFERKDIKDARPLKMDIQKIHEQFGKCHELETEDFRVFTITHKYDSNFHVKYDYASCLAASLLLPILTDGNAYICVEHKMEEKYKLGSCFPPSEIKKWWGGDRHRQMIKDIVPRRDCSRCIYSEYNKQIEQVVLKDKMCINFP